MATMVRAFEQVKRRIPEPVKHPLRSSHAWWWTARGLPGQTKREIALWQHVLAVCTRGRLRVFEYGAGNSTCYYPAFLRASGCDFKWHTVENFRPWHERVRCYLDRMGLADRVHVECHEFAAFWDVPGYSLAQPACLASHPDPEPILQYINAPVRLGGTFDLILIDGRFRRRCLLAARPVVNPDGAVMLHDAQRPHYHAAFAEYPHQIMIEGGRLAGSIQQTKTWIGTICNEALISSLRHRWGNQSVAEPSQPRGERR